MSAFTDCIRSAIEGGKVKAEKGQEAIDAYERQLAAGLAEGLSESAARDAAALRAVEDLGAKTAARKWEKINEVRKQHALYQRVMAAKNEPEEFVRIADEAEIAVERIRGLAHNRMNDFIERSRPKAVGLVHPVRHLDDIVRAGFGGKVANPSAKELADSIKDVMNFLRLLANRQGASIPENKNVFLPQSHSTLKIRRVKGTIEESRKEWIADHLRELDWNVMRYHGEVVPVNEREQVLEGIFNTIASFGDNRIRPGIPSERLTERLARERFLYYKDADSWIKMNKKYGEGNLFEQTVGLVESMSRNIALMEKFGPNPAASINYMFRAAQKKAADQSLAPSVKGRKKTDVAKVDKAISDFQERYRMLSRNLPNSDESVLANTAGNIRTFVAGSMLTGAYIANLGDLSIMKHTALMNKLPITGHVRTYVKMFVPNKKNRALAVRSGLIAESATSMAMGLQRVVGPLEGGAWMKRYSDIIMRAQFLTPHNQAAKWAAGLEMMGMFADIRTAKFDDLPMVHGLRQRGITEEDWELFRMQATHDEQGFRLLRPIDLFNSTTGNTRRNQATAEKFMDYIFDIQRFMVPESDTRTQATLGHAGDPRTWRGQLWKSASMFLAFPVTMMMRHIKQGLTAPTMKGKIAYLSSFFLMLTAAGAFITQVKELARGRDPLDMTTGSFWLRAALTGGSFGLLGDTLIGPGKITEMASGSTAEFLQQLKEMGQAGAKRVDQMIAGERPDPDLERKAVQFFSRYGPWIWQMKLILQRNIADELLQQADPAAYRRMQQYERRRETELNQSSWWRPGADRPQRAPNFGAVFGGSR